MKGKKLGFIVNPIAGIGGRVGLKGSDGKEILRKALELGAKVESPGRSIEALKRIVSIKDDIEVITYPYEMGEEEARQSGFNPTVIGKIKSGHTKPENTEAAAKEMLENGVDLLLFAGGDGTARNIYKAIGNRLPALGIPAGVKIHSAVYATSPQAAGELTLKYLKESIRSIRLQEAEVMDIDEQAFREDRLSAKLYGYLTVPYERRFVQSAKSGTVSNEEADTLAIAHAVTNGMNDDCIYVIGSGTTTRKIMETLGLENTLLGVDAVYRRKLVGKDLNEQQLLELIEDKKACIVVTVIGGQGYIFGRGNQQISSRVIDKVGRGNLIVIATKNKILSLNGKPLRVDTGDTSVDKALKGYIKVVTGFREAVMMPVEY